jgi:hypothetical protein
MSRTPTRRTRWLLAATAAGTIVAAGAATLPAMADDGTQTIEYHGYAVDVPDSWRVVDLTANPNSCLRFDTPAVYFGSPGTESDCPAKVVGRTAGLLIQPLNKTTAAQAGEATAVVSHGAIADHTESVNGRTQVAVEQAGVLVSTIDSPGTVDQTTAVLDSARLTEGAQAATLSSVKGEPSTSADPIVAPGTFHGKGFDACTAQSQTTMDAWKSDSPYSAVGIYTSGVNRGCSQGGLTPQWVAAQHANGWQFILTDVGLQAPCSTRYDKVISTDPATARTQGRDGAAAAISAAQALGFGAGSAVYADIESYDGDSACTTGVLNYVSGWTEELNEAGWLGGMYSSGSSGVQDLCAEAGNPAYTMPDHLWFAWWNDQADTDSGQYCSGDLFADHQRIHQYTGDVSETHGGVTVSIDRDFLDVAPA